MGDTIATRFSKGVWHQVPTSELDLFGWFAWAATVGMTSSEADRRTKLISLFNEVVHAWTSPGRVYHSLGGHLIPLLQRILSADYAVDLRSCSELEAKSLIMAAFYHDISFAVSVPDSVNVQASADLWMEHVATIDSPDGHFAMQVQEEILATDYSERHVDVNYERCLLPRFDLMSLGAVDSEYAANGILLTEERKQMLGDAYDATRARQESIKFLAHMLSQQRLFPKGSGVVMSPNRWDILEYRARENMGRSLAEMLREG